MILHVIYKLIFQKSTNFYIVKSGNKLKKRSNSELFRDNLINELQSFDNQFDNMKNSIITNKENPILWTKDSKELNSMSQKTPNITNLNNIETLSTINGGGTNGISQTLLIS